MIYIKGVGFDKMQSINVACLRLSEVGGARQWSAQGMSNLLQRCLSYKPVQIKCESCTAAKVAVPAHPYESICLFKEVIL